MLHCMMPDYVEPFRPSARKTLRSTSEIRRWTSVQSSLACVALFAARLPARAAGAPRLERVIPFDPSTGSPQREPLI